MGAGVEYSAVCAGGWVRGEEEHGSVPTHHMLSCSNPETLNISVQ